jgi:small subunit ribosomal protein S21
LTAQDKSLLRRAALFLYLKVKNQKPGSQQKRRKPLEVKVIDNDVEKALKILKNKLSKSGLFKELKVRRAYEKPSVKKKRKTIEARRRLAKVQRRRSN